jgi:tRNA-splicing endonuclease subunit Sen2
MSSLTQPQKLRPPRTWKPNYNLLHANPLPLNIQSLPPLIPHNPISWLQILFTYLVCRTKCQPEPLYKAVFSPSTRSVHVTDSRSIQALWNSGFFGKGSLSRSEPTWISRRRRALGIIGKDEALTAEEITERRRRERREFKLERARAEKEKIQSLLAQEGKLNVPTDSTTATSQGDRSGIEDDMTKSITFAVETEPRNAPTIVEDEQNKTIVNVEDLEHLQLTLEEAFFLLYGLGVVNITMPTGTQEGDVCLCHHFFFYYLYNKSNKEFSNRKSQLMQQKPCFFSEDIHIFRPLRMNWSSNPMTPSCLIMSFTTISGP